MSTAADRQRRYLERRRCGRTVIAVEISDVETTEALIESGFLSAADADNRAALADAIGRMIEALTAGK